MVIGIGIEKMVDNNPEHLKILNGLSINTLSIMNKHSGTEYEINDGKIVAEVVNVK